MTQTPRARMLQSQLEHQLEQARRTSELLNRELEKADYPPEPVSGYNRFTIDVQYREGAGWYEYLILRVGGTYYTTGTGAVSRHANWRAFIDWLNANAHHHTALTVLTPHTKGIADNTVTIFDQDEYTK